MLLQTLRWREEMEKNKDEGTETWLESAVNDNREAETLTVMCSDMRDAFVMKLLAGWMHEMVASTAADFFFEPVQNKSPNKNSNGHKSLSLGVKLKQIQTEVKGHHGRLFLRRIQRNDGGTVAIMDIMNENVDIFSTISSIYFVLSVIYNWTEILRTIDQY